MTTDLRFIGDWKLWGAVAIGLALAAAAWFLYRREAKARADYLSWLLPALRSTAVFWLVMMLAGPVLHHRQVIGELARIFLFVDASQSMSVTDEQMDNARKLLIARQMGWLPEGRLDMEFKDAVDRMSHAETLLESAKAEMTPEELIKISKDAARSLEGSLTSLKNIRNESWKVPPKAAAQIGSELVLPTQRLTTQEIGKDTEKFAASLHTLSDAAANWKNTLAKAFTEYADKLTSSNDPEIQKAIKKFDSQPRWKRMEAMLLDGNNSFLTQLAVQHDVQLIALSGSKTEVLWWPGAKRVEDKGKTPESLTFEPRGPSTDLADGVKARLEDVKANEKAAVVLFSDGQHNSGSSPSQIAKLLGNRSIPIFAVGMGSEQRPPDLAILDVKGPDTVYFESNVKGTVELKDDMPAGKPFSLKIELDGKVLWEKKLVTEQRSLRAVAFDFPIKELVQSELQKRDKEIKFNSLPFTLKVTASEMAGERTVDNNVGVLRFSAITERPKVLIVDGRPRWEFRYLRNLFERDQKWEVNSLLTGAGGEYRALVRGNKSGQFPTDLETLYSYQLICLGDIPLQTFTQKEQEWLRLFVEQRGGGLIFVDGPREQLSHYLTTPLKALFPVEWQGAALEGTTLRLQFAAKGNAQAAASLVADPESNAEIWANLKGPHWSASVQALPGSETLLELVAGGKASPAIVFRRYGAGRVLYSSFEESWRWRYEVGDLYHQRFWNQVAKWIMEPPFPVQDRYVSLDSGAITYAPGDTAEVRVRLRDAQGRLKLSGKADAVLLRDGRKVATVALNSDDSGSGILRGRTAELEEGDYEVKVVVPGMPEEELKAKTEFVVKPQGAGEMAALHCNENLLRELAFYSGGEYFREEEIRNLPDRLKPLSQGKVIESETLLWQSWWWFLPVVLLLTIEWWLRKRAGLM